MKVSVKKELDLNNLIRPNVLKMKAYSSARDEFKSIGDSMIFLDANENPFGTDVNRYPDPQQRELKQILVAKEDIGTDQILLGNGSDEVLDLLFRAFCEPGKDNVISLPPTYGMYKVLADLNNIENREVLLTQDFQPDVPKIMEAVNANSKLLFICSPNNPTGNLISEKNVKELLTRFNGLVVIDEAYIDFAKAESWVNKLNEFPNLIVTKTLSKAYGMAGIRLGICYASAEIIAVLNKIKPPYNINSLTQQWAIQELSDTKRVSCEIAGLNSEKEKLTEVLGQLSFVEKVFSSDANFVLIKVDAATKRYQQILEKGVVVRNRSSQPLCENTLRISIGTPEENLNLIKTLQTLI